MSYHHHLLLTCTLSMLQPMLCHTASVVMDLTPPLGKILAGGQGSVQCRVQNADSTTTSLLWYRRQGNIWYKIGSDEILTLTDGSVSDNRYQLQKNQDTDNARNYKLTVVDARLEDSATIECRLSTDLSIKADASGSLIVCDDVSSTFCDCMVTKGWASPDCFTSLLSNAPIDNMWNSVVGLIIAFVVVVAYTLFILLIWKRESLRQCCQAEQMEDMRNLNDSGKADSEDSDRGQVEPSDSMSDSATCSTSDPSSSGGSDGQGSSQTAIGSHSNTHKIPGSGEPDEQGSWKTSHVARHSAESSFTTQPEVHRNRGYSDDPPESSVSHRRRKAPAGQLHSLDPVSRESNFELRPSLAGHGAFGEVPHVNFNTRSNYDKPMISTVSGTITGSVVTLGGDQTQKNLQNYYAPSVLSLRGSQSQLDVEATEI